MKTFETEKNNIPEGATHYMNQTSYSHFAWCRYVGDRLYVTLTGEVDWTLVSEDIFDRNIKPIPQTKEVEWENGDECVWGGFDAVFIGRSQSHKSRCAIEYLRDNCSVIDAVFINELSKPETPEAKKEREELEAAYDLYCDWCKGSKYLKFSFDEFKETLMDKDTWIAIVRKTGYRVEK